MKNNPSGTPGPVALFGSGETAPNGRKVFESLLNRLPQNPMISLLETPAGFELNSKQVAGNIAEFLNHHLQNFRPQTVLIPARKKDTAFSPNDRDLLEPMLEAHLIFLGPGSPTYAVNQLMESLAWEYLLASHLSGTGLALASASTIAVSAFALPVYEIYKVGLDIHWQKGLDLFSQYGLSLSFIPHWNNTDGGEELDTSRCYIGQARFNPMLKMLPPDQTVVGIDEHTGLLVDFQNQCCEVIGSGKVTILQPQTHKAFSAGRTFELAELGEYKLPNPDEVVSSSVYQEVQEAHQQRDRIPLPPAEITELAEERLAAREAGDWDRADALRDEINRQGWQIQDTDAGYELLAE